MLMDLTERCKLRHTEKFSSTNKIWNINSFNNPWNVGSLMNLIWKLNPYSKERWETMYLKGGDIRLNLINEKSPLIKKILFSLKGFKEEQVYYLDELDTGLNIKYGRTLDDLMTIATEFRIACLTEGIQLTLKEAFNYTYIRVIDETYIGYMRELNTMKSIKNFFDDNDHYKIYKTKDTVDIKYAVDCELFFDETLICGIQIKSLVVKNKNPFVVKTNEDKNSHYTRKFNVPVITIFSDEDGKISNIDKLLRFSSQRNKNIS